MQLPSPGRIVHYVLPSEEVRPAIVVRTWGKTPPYPVNLVVFLDGTNDGHVGGLDDPPLVRWATSVSYAEEGGPRTWHWPPHVPAPLVVSTEQD